jgi:two-component system, OmpR family, sensor kinase
MTRRSIRTRLTLVVFAITSAALGFVYVYVAPPLEQSLTEQFLDRMADDARRYSPPIVAARNRDIDEVRRIVARSGDRSNARVTLLRVSRGSLGLQTSLIADSVGMPDSRDLQFDVALEAARRQRTTTGTEASTRGRVAQAAVPVRRGRAVGQVIVYSAPLNDVENNVALVRRRILLGGVVALLFALVAGYVVASRLSRRIGRLERTARSVARGDLSGRFVVDSYDELGKLAVALDDMQRQLGQLDTARKRFIATASHELRTPIFSLGGFLELLQDEDVDPETQQAFLTQVRLQVERLKRLATDLLDLSKLEAGSLQLEREPTDLGVLAEAVTSEFRPALARHESKLQLRLGAGMVEADVDPERVAQVMRILIDNALTHTPPGTNMVVTAARQDGHVRLSVRDNGGGIKRQTIERIFEPFYSAGDGQGSGLGLAIARELAERMDGHLSVEAMAGHTTFTLELPA